MIDIVTRYTCDACKKQACVTDSKQCPSWTVSTEVGDLCPTCLSAWESWKSSFIERMRKENKENVI